MMRERKISHLLQNSSKRPKKKNRPEMKKKMKTWRRKAPKPSTVLVKEPREPKMSKQQEETENKDDPMEGSPKEEPDTKRRKLAEMIEAIPITAEAHGACLACGLAGHSMSECKNTEDREKIANAFEVILSKVKKRHSPKPEEHMSRQKAKDREEPREEIPERMISRYVDSKYIQCDFESIPEVSRQFYLTELTRTLPFRKLVLPTRME